ncbi:MAG: transporter integral rane protein, partial [Acidimicrobiales bacterium]|nr:transporter integral rane protein [Acidimicrobiales bacterium]
MTGRWLRGLLRRRSGRLLGAAVGVALAVGLLGSLGAFVATAKRQMTQRAVAQVAVDWQVEAQPAADPAAVVQVVQRAPHVVTALETGFGTTSGFQATTGGTTQSTGPGVVLGLASGYRTAFPDALRTLVGSGSGVLLAQQTAANLRAGPGDTILVGRAGLPPVPLVVDGVVELPQADSLFQKVGAPAGSQPQAPPDNVVLVPLDRWHQAFDPLRTSRPDLVRTQVHVGLDRQLPPDPAAAFTQTLRMANRLEADLAGGGLVGNNVGATLDAARADALYAEILFLLLGLPGAALAGLLTGAVAGTGRVRRRRELALLRARGATAAVLQRLAVAEAAVVAVAGGALGLAVAAVVGRWTFGTATFGATQADAIRWALAAVLFGAVVAVAAIAVPARRDALDTVAATRREVIRARTPRALRYGVDVVLLVAAALVLWASSRNHYQLVLAPEGVPTVSVNYWTLAGPLLFWLGAGAAVWRLSELLLGRGRRTMRGALRPIAGNLAGPVSSSLAGRRRALAGTVALIALTLTFAISTSVFNATYRQQALVDAVLTNGADVTVTPPPSAGADPQLASRQAGVAGVGHVEAMEHRFAYVGADLQDLYGVDAATIGAAGKLQDAYFTGGSARTVLARLAGQPDAALFSAETVLDFQLHLGDQVHLRLRDAATGRLTDVVFRYAGVAKE